MFKIDSSVEKQSDMFQLLKQMQNYLFDFKKLKLFTLPKPVCLQNEYAMTVFELSNKWLDDFPSLQTVEKFIKGEKKLFYVPEDEAYYYLYYHLLVAYKNFLKLGKNEIYDSKTPLDYNQISDYLIRKNLNATKFFEVYLEKGEKLSETDLVHATLKEFDEVTNYKFDEKIIPQRMTSEPTAPTVPTEFDWIVPAKSEPESEPEIEVPKIVSPLPSKQFEIEVENYPEGKIKNLEMEEF